MKASSARLPPFGKKTLLPLAHPHGLGRCVFLRTPLLASCEVLRLKNPLRNLPRRGNTWRRPRGAGSLDGMSPGGTPWLLNESPRPQRPKQHPFQSQGFDPGRFFQQGSSGLLFCLFIFASAKPYLRHSGSWFSH